MQLFRLHNQSLPKLDLMPHLREGLSAAASNADNEPPDEQSGIYMKSGESRAKMNRCRIYVPRLGQVTTSAAEHTILASSIASNTACTNIVCVCPHSSTTSVRTCRDGSPSRKRTQGIDASDGFADAQDETLQETLARAEGRARIR